MFNSDAFAGQVDMTTKGEWVSYTGSDEQIDEIMNSKYGFIVDSQWSVFNEPNKLQISFDDKTNIDWLKKNFKDYDVKRYWIIPDDPLREMKIRQARTGQPVWYKHRFIESTGECGTFHHPFIQPETYEYSFTAFEE